VLAAAALKEQRYAAATHRLKELVALRRSSEDWGLLGMSYQLQNQPHEALLALQKSLAIRPDLPLIHGKLAEVYGKLGDPQRAQEHREKAHWLSQPRR